MDVFILLYRVGSFSIGELDIGLEILNISDDGSDCHVKVLCNFSFVFPTARTETSEVSDGGLNRL
jgi:hypothetical protein